MLILCIGPDTFRAQEKAQELEVAFKQKYDLGGSSLERLAGGKEAAKQILERSNTASLFSSRRLMRVSDLVTECPKAMQAPLLLALSCDVENTIIISVENEPPPAITLKTFEKVPKLYKYTFPTLQGKDFFLWLKEKAKVLGYTDEARIKRLAEMSDGDSWLAWNELLKLLAGSQEDLTRFWTPTIYEFAERYIKGGSHQHDFMQDRDAVSEALTVFLSQLRAALRVRDGDVEGLNPYLVKKMQLLLRQNEKLEKPFATILQSLLAQRIGYANENEIANML